MYDLRLCCDNTIILAHNAEHWHKYFDCTHIQKSFMNIIKLNQFWFVITFIQLIWYQTGFRLVSNQLENWNYNPNLDDENQNIYAIFENMFKKIPWQKNFIFRVSPLEPPVFVGAMGAPPHPSLFFLYSSLSCILMVWKPKET